MSGDGLGKIMNTIHTTVSQKVDTGEIDQEAMVQQAQSMYQSMGQNPMFQALSMMQGMQGMPQPTPEPAQPRNKTQERLQKKLKQRKAQVKVTKDDQ